MADFPSLPAPASAPWSINDPFIEDTYLDGLGTARAQYSAPMEAERTLDWSALSDANVATLKAFYLSQRAEPFNWTEPRTEETILVRFVGGGLRVDPINGLPGYSKVQIKIRRVGALT